MEEDKEMEEGIQKLQILEQNLQNFLFQRQQLQVQLIEIDSALEELANKEEGYKIIGNIMVKTGKDDLEKDLKKRKKILDLRIKGLEKQEEKIKEKSKSIQEEVLKKIRDKEAK